MIVTNRWYPSLSYKTILFLTPLSFALYKVDIAMLRAYLEREDVDSYVLVLKKVLSLFGLAIHESLTRTLGKFLDATGGTQANCMKTEWEKDIASRMVCTNNGAESPFATVRAFMHIYPRFSLTQTQIQTPVLTLTSTLDRTLV